MSRQHIVDDPARSFFASKSLLEHLARGAVGIGALIAAITIAQTYHDWWATPASLGLGVVALVMVRGCPICWTIGLFETGYRAVRGR